MSQIIEHDLSTVQLVPHDPEPPLPLEPAPRRRSFKGMTHEKLYKRIREGMGIGHLAAYKPWLTLKRRNSSPYSVQVVSWMPPLGRDAHYFSLGEYHTALTLLWVGVQDLREQYPIWPVAHPHPLAGSHNANCEEAPWSQGLLKIAQDADILHGVEIGTKLAYVASIDLLATPPLTRPRKIVGFSSKPIASPSAQVKWRTLERLELERRYLEEIGGRYFVSSSALVPRQTAANLEAWLDCATLDVCPQLSGQVDAFSEIVNEKADWPINQAVPAAAMACGISSNEGWLLFRYCAWHQLIDIDPSRKIMTSHPVQAGGRQLRERIGSQLFGVCDD
ncbi:MAG: hypothetical protein V4805_04370 [Pseudomonadota bacterium]